MASWCPRTPEMIWLDCGSQGRRGKLEGGAAEVRPVLELMASHGKNPTSLALLCRLQSASSEAGLPGSSVQNTSTHDLPLSDCHKGAVIQGLPRPSESHTCSPPSAEASAWSQLPCPSRAQRVHSLAPQPLSPSTGSLSLALASTLRHLYSGSSWREGRSPPSCLLIQMGELV